MFHTDGVLPVIARLELFDRHMASHDHDFSELDGHFGEPAPGGRKRATQEDAVVVLFAFLGAENVGLVSRPALESKVCHHGAVILEYHLATLELGFWHALDAVRSEATQASNLEVWSTRALRVGAFVVKASRAVAAPAALAMHSKVLVADPVERLWALLALDDLVSGLENFVTVPAPRLVVDSLFALWIQDVLGVEVDCLL